MFILDSKEVCKSFVERLLDLWCEMTNYTQLLISCSNYIFSWKIKSPDGTPDFEIKNPLSIFGVPGITGLCKCRTLISPDIEINNKEFTILNICGPKKTLIQIHDEK